MKKGFTLIELLTVVVIVGILVAVALPKYKMSLERGRAVEGMANAAALSEALNACYIQNYNSYTGCDGKYKNFATTVAYRDFILDEDIDDQEATVMLYRMKSGSVSTANSPYRIIFKNERGENISRSCSGSQKYCRALGAVQSSSNGWDFK